MGTALKFTCWIASLLSSFVPQEFCLLLPVLRLFIKSLSTVLLIPWFSTPDCRQAAVLSPQNILVVFNYLLL